MLTKPRIICWRYAVAYNENVEYLYSVVFPSFSSSKAVHDELVHRHRKETEKVGYVRSKFD